MGKIKNLVTGKNSRRLLTSYSLLIYLFIYIPILIVIILSFTPREVPTFPMPGLSLKWYYTLLPPEYDEGLITALFRSTRLALVTSIGAGVVGTLAALGMVRNDLDISLFSPRYLNTVFMTPLAVPWVVTGIAVLTFYNFINISGSFLSVVIGHMIVTIPIVILIVSTQLYGFDRSLEEAAKNLGATNIRAFYEVTLPLISPGVIAGMLFAFTLSFDNFTQTYFWVGLNQQTLPIVIFSRIRYGLSPNINAIGTVVMLFSLTIALIAEKLSSRYV